MGSNYHISVERMNYSVPFEYIKQKVDVRLTKDTVEVFYGGNRICSHPRLYGRFNQYSTIKEHMPPEHQKYVQWNGERFIHWIGKVSNNTQVAVQAILGSYKIEQQLSLIHIFEFIVSIGEANEVAIILIKGSSITSAIIIKTKLIMPLIR